MSLAARQPHLLHLPVLALPVQPRLDVRSLLDLTAPRRFVDGLLRAVPSMADEGSQVDPGLRNSRSSANSGMVTTGATTDDGDDPDEEPRKPGKFAVGEITMEDLIREHADAVYRVALSVTRDPSLAEDVSQDALIKAWRALPSFRGDSPLRNWVLRITHNTAISALRKRRDELREPDQLPERETLRSVESAVQDRLAIDRFEEALADLDSVSRSIVVLREVEGLSYAELCEVLDLPMPTIKTRLLRARRQLAQALEGWQP